MLFRSAVAALFSLAAVGIKNQIVEIEVCGAWRGDHEKLIKTNAALAVAPFCNLLGLQCHGVAERINDHEVIA